MADRRTHDPAWQPWIEQACAAVGVDPALVDTDAVLAMTRQIAHGFDRPMAPVGAYILGLAVASGGDADLAALRRAIVATLPAGDADGGAGTGPA